jgi:hypothetical protein
MTRFRRIPGSPVALLALAGFLSDSVHTPGVQAQSASAVQAPAPQHLQTIEWPRQYLDTGDTVIVYDPQVDSWNEYVKLAARSAMAVTPKGSKQAVYGVVEYTVDTEVDVDRQEVLCQNRKVTAIRFTGLEPSDAARADAIVRRVLKPASMFLPLPFVLAHVEADEKAQRSVAVNMDPPPIFSSETTAILVMYFGKPEFKPITGTDLQFCVNTNWDVLLHPGTSQYYLLDGEGWLTTKDLSAGPWSATTSLPASLSQLPANDNWSEVKKHVPGKQIPVPKVFYTEKPAELIALDGPAKWADIPPTGLRYTTNTVSHLFMHKAEANYYFLTSGRWFRAKGLAGPWSAATTTLPADFAKIPADSPKGSVLTSVPGTPQAKDAILLAEVPHKASVDPKSVSVNPTYDGAPKFELIEGTKVSYAVNSPYSVLQVGNGYYCCKDAIWFCAPSANGPWAVCASVPQEIYSIPSSSPVHNVTYVYLYDSTPNVVVMGYTAGYTGVYVSSGVVVYGAAYPMVYAPYSYYHYYPSYYGYGCAMHYNYAYGTYYRSAQVYGPYGGAGYATAYNPATGTYARGAAAYGPYGSRYAAQSYNPYTGTYKARAGGSTPYSSWGQGVVSNGDQWARGGYYSDSRGTVAGVQGSQGGAAVGVKTDDGGAAVARTQSGDMYAAKDGNVYKKGDDGSWSQAGGAAAPKSTQAATGATAAPKTGQAATGAAPATRESAGSISTQSGSANRSSPNTQEMDRQSQNRSRGWQSTQRSGSGGGGSAGGGGARRR